MEEIRLIDIREGILADNDAAAGEIRAACGAHGVLLLNLMAAPGAGKTSLILQTVRRLGQRCRIAVVEGDIASRVDAERVAAEGVKAVQLRTGGACHLDAAMVRQALNSFEWTEYDLILVENVGNLVCPAEFDIGQGARAMILSVPEGDDKPLKYPLMFTVCDAVVVNKTDALPLFDFDAALFEARVRKLNPGARVLPLSAKTGEGLEGWLDWLEGRLAEARGRAGKETTR